MPTRPNKEAIFNRALEIEDTEQRATFVAGACGDDKALQADIEQLLEMDHRPDSLFDFELTNLQPASNAFPMLEKPGDDIGPFNLLQTVGEGGMGVVYLAEQEKPVRRSVALKIVKPGLETRHIVGRFEAERQVLALMDHPNIAKVFDGGTTKLGRPYFVMELVKGMSVTKYCDMNHLPLRDRLQLFVPICQGIQHAHQKGIIHRDIKPNNILVAEYDHAPVPKVIDFGIAKSLNQRLTEQTVVTEYGQVVGTIDYMSPEQAKANQLDIDTRSDIYSLGVLLYELLTGATPFDKKRLGSAAWDERLRIIREEDPPSPSTRVSAIETLPLVAANRRTEPRKLAASLHGELDWIVLKAMAKDRGSRYETASEFAADIGRFLNDEPVKACPPSTAYKVKKFVRRNSRNITAASLIGLALLVSVGMTASGLGWMARDRQARQANADSQLESILHQAENLMSRQQWQEALVVAQRGKVITEAGEPSDKLRFRSIRVLNDLRIVQELEDANLQANDWNNGDFDRKRIESLYSAAFTKLGVSIDNVNMQAAADRLHSHPDIHIALVDGLTSWALACANSDPAGDRWRNVLAIANAVDPHPWRTQVRNAWLDNQFELLGRLVETAPFDSLSASDAVLMAIVLRAEDQNDLAAEFLKQVGIRFRDSIRVNYELAIISKDPVQSELFNRAALAARPNNPAILVNLGFALYRQTRYQEAIECARLALHFDPQNVMAHNNLGHALSAIGRHDAALRSHRNATELDPGSPKWHRMLATELVGQGRLEEAVKSYQEAIELDPTDASAQNSLGIAYKRMGKFEQALECFHEAINLRPDDAIAHFNCGVVCDELGQVEQALVHKRKALRIWPDSAPIVSGLGVSLRKLGKLNEALDSFRKAIEIDDQLVSAYANQALALMDLRKYEEAVDSARKAIALRPDSARLHAILGDCFRKWNKLDQSVASYREAVKLDPRLPNGYFNLGTTLLNQGKSEEAVAALCRAVEFSPNDSSVYSNLGRALQNVGQLDHAIEQYQVALKLRPDNAFAHNSLGSALRGKGEHELAISHHRRAIELAPNLANAHYNLALVLNETGNMAEAVDATRKALLLAPNHCDSRIHLGMLLQRQGEQEQAVACFRKAIEYAAQLESDAIRVKQLDRLSVFSYRAGLWQVSLEARLRKNTLVEESLEDQLCLAMIHWQLGNLEKAKQRLNRASAEYGNSLKNTPDDGIAKLFDVAKELLQQED